MLCDGIEVAVALAGAAFGAYAVIDPISFIRVISHFARVGNKCGVTPIIDVEGIRPLSEIIAVGSESDIRSAAGAHIVLVDV